MTYKVPEKITSMTVHFPDGKRFPDVVGYLDVKGFALAADLLLQGFKPADIEEAVNNQQVDAAHWPEKEPLTDLYFVNNGNKLATLEELAEQAVKFCYGKSAEEPIGGNYISVGAEMGSQQLALVGLIYAREKGRLRELAFGDKSGGPLYVVKGGFSDKIFEMMFP